MDREPQGSSDDDVSLPSPQLSATTQALLAQGSASKHPGPPQDGTVDGREGDSVQVRGPERAAVHSWRSPATINQERRPRVENPVGYETRWNTSSANAAATLSVRPRRFLRQQVPTYDALGSPGPVPERQNSSSNASPAGAESAPAAASPSSHSGTTAIDRERYASHPRPSGRNATPSSLPRDRDQVTSDKTGRQPTSPDFENHSPPDVAPKSVENISGGPRRDGPRREGPRREGPRREISEHNSSHAHDREELVKPPAYRDMRRVYIAPAREPDVSRDDKAGLIVAPLSVPTELPPTAVPPPVQQSDSTANRDPQPSDKRRTVKRITVNQHRYTILRKLGKGGSGRVYEVVSSKNEAWAIKTIPLANMDPRTKKQIENEVNLLKSLDQQERVIYLLDWAVDEAKKCLYMVMELGQCDLDTIWRQKIEDDEKFDVSFTGYYWREMVLCVALIHKLDVVHSDLKPANFVLVRGKLKLVDFGIANAIPDDTVNIYLEHQSGTPNYMAPESIKNMSTGRQAPGERFKFGKPSDIWSLGCILYQMAYGQQPFAHIRGLVPKFMAIGDPKQAIEYAKEGLGGVNIPLAYIRTMKACLARDLLERPTADELMRGGDGLLQPRSPAKNVVYVTSSSVEALFNEALEQTGTWASPEEITTLVGGIMAHIENTQPG